MLGFLQSPQRKITDKGVGFISEETILQYSHKDCNGYLIGTHSKKELKVMLLKDKINLILDLEYNFQSNSM